MRGRGALVIAVLAAALPAGAETPEQRLAHALSFATVSHESPEKFEQAPFDAFVERYNEYRGHGSLGGRTPMSVLVNNVSANHT